MKGNKLFSKYASCIFKERLQELGITQNKFVNTYAEQSNRSTLAKIIGGYTGTNVNLMAHYCELLGLEMVIRKKDDKKVYEN